MGAVIDVLGFAGDADEVRRATMAPPELARDAPVLDAVQPAVPVILRLLRIDFEFSKSCALYEKVNTT